MRDKANGGKGPPLGPVSQVLDIGAPFVAVLLTAVLVMERTPRNEPLLYGFLVVTLVSLAWAATRSRSDYGFWALYIGGFTLFGVVRSFADETGMPVHVGDLVSVEKTLAFGQVPTVWLQQQLFHPGSINWIDRAATYVHWSYFVLPHLFAAHIFLAKRHLFERYVLVFVGVLLTGLVLYFLFPAAPPWVASLTGHIGPVHKVVTEVGSEFNVNLYSRFEDQLRSSNPVAAMPSVHMAISVVVLLMAFKLGRMMGALALVYNAAMAFSLVYLGEHYVTDIVAGVAVAVGVYALVAVWYRWRAPGEEPLSEEPQADEMIEGRPLKRPPAESGLQI